MKKFLVGVAAAVALFGANNANALLIDDFDTDQSTGVFGPPPGPTSASSQAAGGVGGQRDMMVNRLGGGSGAVMLDSNITLPSIASFATGPGTPGTALVSWDGVDGSSGLPPALGLGGGGGVDLTDGGTSSGLFLRGLSDLGVTIVFTIYTTLTDFSTRSLFIPGGGPLTTFFVSFASFVVGGGAGATFSTVRAITMLIDGSAFPGTDVQIDFLTTTTVPEPASLLLIGSGLTALGLLGRRRKTAARPQA